MGDSNQPVGHVATSDSGASLPVDTAGLRTVPLIWTYHSVAPGGADPYKATVSPPRFERQMRWLHDNRLRGVSMGELLDAADRGTARGLVGLTFDDGYRDFVTHAMPILQRFGFTATVFVLSGRFGGHNAWDPTRPRKALLNADEVCEMARAGMEIGSHGLKHVSLPDADDETLNAETRKSRVILHDLLGHHVRGFCYPYGHLDARVVAAVRAAGYDYACATAPSPAIGRYAIPRTSIHDGDSAWRLYAKWIRAGLQVGNQVAVRHHRRGARWSSAHS